MFDLKQAVESLAEQAMSSASVAHGWPGGAPVSEYTRSPAAYRIAKHAAASGLFLFHYEHRAHLELPEEWVPAHDPSLAAAPEWVDGILPERKYQSFRHDQLIGGFHPGHRAKWSTHEFCHGLVGFAWHREASPLFLATAGRMAELLPVVLWYFFDECYLKRCPVHAHGGALFRTHCPACEDAAGFDPTDPNVLERLSDGLRYLDRELAAIARTRRLKKPVPHIWGSLDLCSDGIAYAGAHGPRLRSGAFHRFSEWFLKDGEGWVQDLESLESRVVEVARAIVLDTPLRPWCSEPAVGADQWIRQDIGWRLLCIAEQCDDEVSHSLHQFIESFSDRTVQVSEALATIRTGYVDLFEEVVLPPWEEVAAVGYPLPTGGGVAVEQVVAGVQSALPATSTAYGADLGECVAAFLGDDAPRRRPLASRFEAWLGEQVTSPVRDLLRYETMYVTSGPRDGTAMALQDDALRSGPLQLASGVRVGCFEVQPATLLEEVEFGDRTLVNGRLPDVDGHAVESFPCGILCFRNAVGQVETVEVSVDVARALESGATDEIEPAVLDALWQLGLLVPQSWEIDATSGV